MKDKLNNFYINKTNKYLKKLDKDKINLQNGILKIEEIIEEKNNKIDLLDKKLKYLNFKYESFTNYLINRGLFFERNNLDLQLNDWENLVVCDENNKIILKDKNFRVIKVINEEGYKIISDIKARGYKVKALVIRASRITALIQVFFTKEI